MKKRVLSLLMAFALCFTMLPTAAFAELADAAAVKTQSSENTADAYTIGDDTVVQDEESPDAAVQAAQALIDALPEDVTAENAEEIEQRLMALDAALEALTDEQLAQLDMTRYETLCATMTALTAEQAGEHTDHPICGNANCTESGHQLSNGASWTAISTVEDLTNISAKGYYYLTASVELTKQWTPANGVVLCLNGNSITAKDDFDVIRVATYNDTFTLCNCKNTGSITHANGNTGRGVLVGGTFNMYGGSITGNSYSADTGSSDGGGVSVSYGTFNMYGGSITGNSANNSGGGVGMSGGTFTMSGGEITRNTAENGGGVYVDSNGSFTVSGDAKITTNTAGSYGGGVFVDGGGTFTMNGGEITGNNAKDNGGGVYVGGYGNGTFNMTGGSIGGTATADANTAKNGGGVYVDRGEFTMSGGSVTGNSASGSGYGNGGGVFVASQGEFTMSETAAITGNTASSYGGGVYVNGGTFTMSGGSIGGETDDANTASNGGGVYVTSSGTFTMSGGEITGNTATTYGGGVFVYDTFNMSGGSISGNNAVNGGGVYVASQGAFTMSGSAAITGNTASTGNSASSYGGGVYVNGTFTMTSGSITGNTVTGGNGGGVGISGGTFNMSGGSITGNTATFGNTATSGNGGGVYVNGTFNIYGAPSITGNTGADDAANNLYLDSNSEAITVTGKLTGEAGSIGVTSGANFVSSAANVAVGSNTYQLTANDAEKFCADSSIYEIVYVASSKTVVIQEKPHEHRVCGETDCTDDSHTEVPFRPLTKSSLGTKQSGYYLSEGSYYLAEDLETDAPIRIADNVKLCLNGHSITVTDSYYAIQVSSGTFTLTDCDGSNGSKTFKKNSTTGQWVLDGSGDVTVTGGIITHESGQNGGAVEVDSGAVFTMYGGTLVGNTGTNGAVYVNGGSFTMHGGAIKGNYFANGGGVGISSGTFTMSGGSITSNTAKDNGGGVYVSGGTFTMTDGSITDNTADDSGGGVYVDGNGTFTMSGGSITGNNATGRANMGEGGGGVFVYGNGKFTMSGDAKITGNNTTGCGGGVGLSGDGTVTVSGSVQITGNWQNGTLNSTSGLYEKGVRGNANNLYLDSGKTIAIGTDGLNADARIGVNTRDDPSVKIATNATEEQSYYAAIFTPDAEDSNYEITKNTDDNTLYLSVHVHTWAYTADDTTHTITAQCNKCNQSGGSVTLKAPEGTLTYDGNGKAATLTGSFLSGVTPTISYTQTKPILQALKNGALPTSAGIYEASITMGTGNGAVTASVTYEIGKATPKAEDFTFGVVGQLTYDGTSKTAQFTPTKTGMGAVTVKYYQGEAEVTEPKNAGDYTVKIDVAEGRNYAAATGLTANEWEFSISRAKLNLNAGDFTFKAADNLIYNGKPKTAEVTWKTPAKATGFGAITVKYYDENGTKVNEPTEAGTYTVRIDVAAGVGYEAQSSISSDAWTFEIKQVQQKLSFQSDKVNKVYGEATFTNPIQESDIQGAITYTSSNTGVATVDTNGTVTILAASTEPVTITASTEGTNNYSSATASYTLTVAKKPITGAVITLGDSLTYNGGAQTQTVTSVKLGALDVTYTVSGSTATNAGTYTLTVTGTGNFTGTAEKNFTVAPKSIADAAVSAANTVYTGKMQMPVVTSVTVDGLTLTAADYTLESRGAVSVGNYTFTLTGKGNFTGTAQGTFTVTKAALTVSPIRLDVTNNYASEYTADLRAALEKALPENSRLGAVTYDAPRFADDKGYCDAAQAAISTNGVLTLPVKAVNTAAEGEVARVTVAVTCGNFENTTVTVVLYAANKPVPTGTPTPSRTTLTYGEALNSITLSGKMTSGGENVPGTFAWKEPNLRPAAGELTAVWVFTPDDGKYASVTGTIRLTVSEPVVPTYTVGGTVKTYSLTDSTAPKQPAADAIVTIRKGVEILGGQKRTDAEGQFSLDGVPAGVYNVVVEYQGKTVTQKVEITDHNVAGLNVEIPLEDVNSKLDIKDSGGLTGDLVVGGLEKEANDQFTKDGNTASGGSVDVKMEIESKPEDKDDAAQNDIREKAKDKALDFIDMALSLVRNGKKDTLPETKNVLEIIISYDTSRAGITVIRHHGDEVQSFERLDILTPGQDKTFYVDEANKCIHIFTSRFSTYAIGYEPAGSSGGSSGGVYATGGNSSPATGDAGLLPYAAMALTGCTGVALTLRRKRRED